MASILVVEDERLVAKDIQNVLTRIGYQVPGVVSSGEEAIAKAEEMRPDLVLMDIMLKGGLDGIETAGVMRDRLDIPVVYLTAFGDLETVRRAGDTQAFGYLLKPFTESDLRSAIEIALHKHEADALLRKRERWFATTLASIGDAVLTTDADRKVTFMNHVAEQLLGYGAKEVLGDSVDTILMISNESLTTGDLLVPSSRLRRRNGELIAVEHSTAPIFDDSGEVLGSVIVFRDISRQKRIQEQLAIGDRLASLGSMASGVALEINSPLAYMLTNMEFASRELSGLSAELQSARLEEIREAVNEAYEGANRVRRVVRDLKTFSQPDEKSRRPLDLHEMVRLAARICARDLREKARLELHLQPVPLIQANEARLGQVLVNLLMNAIHAVEAGRPEENCIRIATRTDPSGQAVVEVKDSGAGIRPELVGQVFDPFFNTKSSGSGMGLGLAICHRLVTEIGGAIGVESAPGEGSLFRVTLPASAFSPSLRPTPVPRIREVRRRILVIDAERLLLVALQRSLAKVHEVTILTDPREGLARVTRGERFDAIVCDLMIPAMHGVEFYESLKALAPAQAERVIFLSGSTLDERAECLLAQLSDRRLEKPFEISALNEMIESVIGVIGTE